MVNQSLLTKSGQTRSLTIAMTVSPHPQAVATGSTSKTQEETRGSDKKHFISAITEHHSKGNIQWGITIDDVNLQKGGIDLQKWGIDMGKDVLPAARFEFLGNSIVPAPPEHPPRCMDIAIKSYWSMILPSEPKNTWIRKLLHSLKFRSTGPTSESYSNLFQIVALTADLSNLQEPSHYIANVEVRPQAGASNSQAHNVNVKRQAADSVYMTPVVADGMYLTLLTCGHESDETNTFRSTEAMQLQSPSNGKV